MAGAYSEEEEEEWEQYTFRENEIIGQHYRVIAELGGGTFSTVFEAIDQRTEMIVALKIIRQKRSDIETARKEAKVLKQVNDLDADNTAHIIRIFDSFDWKGHFVLVFEKLGHSLCSLIDHNECGFPLEMVKEFSRQLLTAIKFIHDIKLTHTDLKPENILLISEEVEECKGKLFPVNLEIKLIDFGGATFEHDYHSPVINTRHYMSPEVLLELGWDMSSDIWSLGCVLVELLSGNIFFPSLTDTQHLAMYQKALGRIPEWMAKQA